jgi:hypothetical protein
MPGERGRRYVDVADIVARDGCKLVGDLGVGDRLRPGDHQGLTEAGAFDKDGGGGPCTPSPLLVGGALAAWLAAAPAPGPANVMESEHLLKLFYADHGTRDDLLAALTELRRWAESRSC